MVEQLANQLGEGGSIPTSPLQFTVRQIPAWHTYEWLLKKHYAHRIPSISYAFGLYLDKHLWGVMTIGKPASPFICNGLCGEDYAEYVYEFNRLCITEPHPKNVGSFFISRVLRLIRDNMVIVSYADTKMGHIGYIYQATNWLYTGITRKMVDRVLVGSTKHARHNNIYEVATSEYECIDRSQKHRYVYFIGDKEWLESAKAQLRYPNLPYPKGDNQRYDASYEPTRQGVLI